MIRCFKTDRAGKDGKPLREFRLTGDDVTLSVVDAEKRIIQGYAMVWNKNSLPDMFGEVVRLLPGSAIFDDPCVALYNHNWDAVLGNTENGTLSTKSDETGVKVTIGLPKTTLGADVFTLVLDKYVQGMSFLMYDWSSTFKQEGGSGVELVNKFYCAEVTVTVAPRFPDTTIGVAEPSAASSPRAQFSAELERVRTNLARHRLRLHKRH